MESQEKVKVPVLKRDAKITITVGAQMIQALQGLSVQIMNDHQDQADALRAKLENKQQLEPWEHTVVVLTQFLKAVGEQAEKEGQIYYKDPESLIGQ